jgi:hypothetical protein
MKKIYLLFALSIGLFFSCQKEEVILPATVTPTVDPTPVATQPIAPQKTKSELLAGEVSKAWKYSLITEDTSCPASEKFHTDNTYTFFADKKMNFDNGLITEEGNCGDLASVEGSWQFSATEDSLFTYASRRTDTGASLNNQLFVGGKLVSITPDKFILVLGADSIVFTPR